MVLESCCHLVGNSDHDRVCCSLLTGMLSPELMTFSSFLIFPSAFPNSRSEGLSSRGSAIIAVVLLAVGYVSVTILSLVCKSWLFRMDVIYV